VHTINTKFNKNPSHAHGENRHGEMPLRNYFHYLYLFWSILLLFAHQRQGFPSGLSLSQIYTPKPCIRLYRHQYVPHVQPILFFLIWSTEWYSVRHTDRKATHVGINIFYVYGSVHHNILWNNQQMQLYAVNFIPLLSSLYMFRAPHTPIIRSTMLNCIYSHWYKP